MEDKYHQPLQRICNGEYIFESHCRRIEAKKAEQPRDTKQGKNDRGGLGTSFNFLDLRLALNVPCPHHLTNHQEEYHGIYLREKKNKKIYSVTVVLKL